jgi:hypothetical protein
MDRTFLLAGDQDGRVTEIIGLETVQRLAGGRYTLTEEAVAKAAKALAEYEAKKAQAQRLTIVRGRDSLDTAKGVGKTLDDRRGFVAKLAYDEENLYARYEVDSPHGLVNATPDKRILFKGGNLLDLQVATNPAADAERKRPAAGDVRVLITRQEEEPVAVVYRPKVEGFEGQPTVLESPTGTESFDRIEVTERVKLDYRERDRGFTATAAIPLEVLGWAPKPGQSVRLDVGYIFGNEPGTRAAIRAYWHNNSFTANVVDDVPHESRLEPGEWGTALVE